MPTAPGNHNVVIGVALERFVFWQLEVCAFWHGEVVSLRYKRLFCWEDRKRKFQKRLGRGFFAAGVSFFVILSGICIKNGVQTKTSAKEPLFLAQQGDEQDSGEEKAANYYKRLYKKKKASTIVSVRDASKKQIKKMFYKEKISDAVFKRMYRKSYKKGCTVPKRDLRYVRVLYYGFDKKTHIGELVVNRRIAKDICSIFYQLYCKKYQIEKMVLIDEYDASDEDSMADNNTSAFNYRPVSGTTRLSKHSYGMAIDINPFYNPYLHTVNGKRVCEPAMAQKYLNRSRIFAHKIDKKDVCYKLFTKYGFSWGGNWRSVKDYQHFEKTIS